MIFDKKTRSKWGVGALAPTLKSEHSTNLKTNRKKIFTPVECLRDAEVGKN